MLLPDDLWGKYPRLCKDDVYSAIEIASIRVAQVMLGKVVQANVEEDGLHLYTLGKGETKELNLKGLRRIISKPLMEEIEIELMRRDAIAEANQYKGLRGSVVTGQISGRSRNGDYSVFVEIAGVPPTTFYAAFPHAQQCNKDRWRGSYNIGSILSFYFYSTEVACNSNRSWLRHTVSRSTKAFPCALLSQITGITGIKCTERVPGDHSIITSHDYIPPAAIRLVGKELKETLNVKCTKTR